MRKLDEMSRPFEAADSGAGEGVNEKKSKENLEADRPIYTQEELISMEKPLSNYRNRVLEFFNDIPGGRPRTEKELNEFIGNDGMALLIKKSGETELLWGYDELFEGDTSLSVDENNEAIVSISSDNYKELLDLLEIKGE